MAKVNTLRIALWTDLEPNVAINRIQQKAKQIALECKCNLTTWATDLYEYDEKLQGHVLKYDALVGGELNVTVVKPDIAEPVKPVRWN